ncbi:MAG TPA: hypothetical protein VF522_24400 [Ramlibacter sp.]|uniref:hypothetical protein n=1 Tax=Ramlibacter sp. TaxID=1917967 RepID=UPI002ED23F8F
MNESERKNEGHAQHGYRNEVSWDGGAGRQPYTNQEAEIGPATAKEFEGGNTGDASSRTIRQTEELRRQTELPEREVPRERR